MDRKNLVVWIDALDVAERESAGRLCLRHADALEGPRGWTTDDRRQPVPTLFRARDKYDDTTGSRRPRTERKVRPANVDTPSLFESIRRDLEAPEQSNVAPTRPDEESIPEDASVQEVIAPETEAVDPDDTQAMSWAPRIGRGATPAKDPTRPVGRLLGRAFGDEAGDE